MAEKKTETKSPKAKAKPAAKAEATAAVVSLRGACTNEGCKQPLRAKGYCRKHYLAWRRGKLGVHHHYKICSKEACRKPRAFGGLCAEHAGKGQPAEAAAAS